MPETKNTLQKVAEEFAAAFHTQTRPDGSVYTTRKDDCPEWIDSNLCHKLHLAVDDRLPDDWTYGKIANIADALTNYDDDNGDDLRERMHEIADGQVDIYNSDLTKWLASNNFNACIVDEACEELGSEDCETIKRIQIGQYWAIDKLGHAIISAIEEEADSREE